MAAHSCSFPISSTIYQLLLFGTGAVVMRGAGCTINDLWDRDIDDKVERTRLRPLAAKTVTPFQAFQFLGLQLSVGLAVLTQLNWYSIFLGAASLSVVVVYPLMKRITYWPQLVLGLAFNWGALLGSSAILGYTNWAVALPLYAGSIAWTLVYDTIYAHQDKSDDIHASVKSTALLFGEKTVPVLSAFSVTYLSLLSYAGYMNEQGLPFYAISVLGGAAHLVWQLRGLKINDRADCWMRFKSNRDFGAIVFAGLWVDYMVKMLF